MTSNTSGNTIGTMKSISIDPMMFMNNNSYFEEIDTDASYLIDNNFSMTIAVCNPMTTLCHMVYAPPLDILRKGSDVYNLHRKIVTSNHNYRTSRYWLCLINAKLFLFQYYGDSDPRFVSDVTEASVTIVREKDMQASQLINLHHADGRVWLIEFQNKTEASHFEFIFNEVIKARTESGSRFMKSSDVLKHEMSFGYNLTIY